LKKKAALIVHVETLKAARVACYPAVSETPEEDALHFMENWIKNLNIDVHSDNYGFDIEVTEEQTKAGMRGYEVWRSVPEGVQPSDGVVIKDFSGGLYATTILDKPFEDPFTIIPAGWKDLHEWVIFSDQFRSGSHQWLEQLVPGEGGSDLKLFYPLVQVEKR
jgi:hypothetical protein